LLGNPTQAVQMMQLQPHRAGSLVNSGQGKSQKKNKKQNS